MLFRYYFLIKLYINTYKYSVKTGTNRYKWVCMGAYGCVGGQGTRGVQKQGKRGYLWARRAGFGPYGRGIFPGHRTQILVCATINTPRLPCFYIPCAPCSPAHPSAPIHTQLYLFVPVCTLYFHVYMYNLIKKYYLNNVYFKIFILVSSY